MDLFTYMAENRKEKEAPLAARLRPETLEEVVGQQHIIGKDKLLYRAIKADKLGSVIFYGPPGTGKTTLARVIANTTSARFTQINATVAGKKDMEEVVAAAKEALGMYGKKTILFIDEIHRFNKGQQDYLLPFVEDGTVILIGATTENPYFEVNGALLSRSIIFELKPLSKEDVKELLRRAVTDEKKGMGAYGAVLDADAAEFLADMAGGDARLALNAVELGILTTPRSEDGKIRITLDVAAECIQKRVVKYDKTGDNHYDTISAFIKSMRGSDPDAAVYYLAKMLYAGESVAFIARRIMICASEDVGNADPQALQVAVSASLAVERVGMPEAQIILANAATYVACAPKSNSAVCAISEASKCVQETGNLPIPPHLQDAHYKGAAKLGHGLDYKYAHDYPNHYVRQQYLPYELSGKEFYRPSGNGYEAKIDGLELLHHVFGLCRTQKRRPVLTPDGGGKLLGGDGQADAHQIHVPVLCHELRFVFPVYQLVVVALNGGFVPQLQPVAGEIVPDVVLDGVADAVLKIMKRVFSLLRQRKLRPVQDGLGVGEARLRQIGENGLEGEKIGVVPVQDEFGDLRGGQGKIHAVEHVKNHKLVKGGRFLIHGVSSPAVCPCLMAFCFSLR